ncbi:MAG: Fe2+-dependent dioxygenase [Rudaea sp.]|uniref:Fe2+-dependent dioxygenase n=1 Tax=Rudaea sp. TaxID=2136325 RepID=UPI0039E32059
MMLHIPQVLNPTQVSGFRERLAAANWADGRITAGYQSARAKHNQQLPEDDPDAIELGKAVRMALKASTLFFSAALPHRIFPPLFNRYGVGHGFGAHIDNAVRYDRSEQAAGKPALAVRTDLSATLFLSSPDEYDGGELVVQDAFGEQKVKLPAGDLILYPASSVHRVEAITRGERLASFFWIQSMVRDDGERTLLFQLDGAIQKLNRDHLDHPSMVELTGVYHNLLRRWAEL